MPTLMESVVIIRHRINNRGQLAISLINQRSYANLRMLSSLKQVSFMLRFTKDIRRLWKWKKILLWIAQSSANWLFVWHRNSLHRLKCFHMCVQESWTHLSIWHFQSSQLASSDTHCLRNVEKTNSNFRSNCISETCDVLQVTKGCSIMLQGRNVLQ